MKKKLVILPIMLATFGMLAMTAPKTMAHDRDDHRDKHRSDSSWNLNKFKNDRDHCKFNKHDFKKQRDFKDHDSRDKGFKDRDHKDRDFRDRDFNNRNKSVNFKNLKQRNNFRDLNKSLKFRDIRDGRLMRVVN